MNDYNEYVRGKSHIAAFSLSKKYGSGSSSPVPPARRFGTPGHRRGGLCSCLEVSHWHGLWHGIRQIDLRPARKEA